MLSTSCTRCHWPTHTNMSVVISRLRRSHMSVTRRCSHLLDYSLAQCQGLCPNRCKSLATQWSLKTTPQEDLRVNVSSVCIVLDCFERPSCRCSNGLARCIWICNVCNDGRFVSATFRANNFCDLLMLPIGQDPKIANEERGGDGSAAGANEARLYRGVGHVLPGKPQLRPMHIDPTSSSSGTVRSKIISATQERSCLY